MSITTCPNCSSPVPPGSIFCDNCGFDLRTVSAAGQRNLSTTAPDLPPVDGSITCPTCGYINIGGSVFCENCGSQLTQLPKPAQAPPPMTPVAAPPAAPVPPAPAAAMPPAAMPAVTIRGKLVIQSSNVTLEIPSGKQVVIMGREDPVSGIFPDIDLDPYGAQEEGVGRRHAQFVMRGGDLYLEDLESVNGTLVNRQRLVARQPHPIVDGDEIRLGKLIMIYKAG